MSIPTPYVLMVRRWSESDERDEFNNPVAVLSPPRPIRIHGIHPGQSVEAVAAGRQSDEVAFTVLAPRGTELDARDVVVIDGVEFHVRGDSRDWGNGPWRFPAAGVEFELVHARG